MDKIIVNVVWFKRHKLDNWHRGVSVNTDTNYAKIIDNKGNVYTKVYKLRDMFTEGCFCIDKENQTLLNEIKEENQIIK